jgi:hypothetical protein
MLYIVCLVVFVVGMLVWAGFGYSYRDPARPYGLGYTFAPWLCVLILGLIVFGAVGTVPAVVVR